MWSPHPGRKSWQLRFSLVCKMCAASRSLFTLPFGVIGKQYLPLIKFRTSNHSLPIETGRWENVPFDDRKCQLCHKNELGDEFHYLFCCTYFETERKRHLKPYFYKRPNIIKLKELLASDNLATLKKLSEFVQIVINKCATTFST